MEARGEQNKNFNVLKKKKKSYTQKKVYYKNKGEIKTFKNKQKICHQQSFTEGNFKRYTSNRRTVITDRRSDMQEVFLKSSSKCVGKYNEHCVKPQ